MFNKCFCLNLRWSATKFVIQFASILIREGKLFQSNLFLFFSRSYAFSCLNLPLNTVSGRYFNLLTLHLPACKPLCNLLPMLALIRFSNAKAVSSCSVCSFFRQNQMPRFRQTHLSKCFLNVIFCHPGLICNSYTHRFCRYKFAFRPPSLRSSKYLGFDYIVEWRTHKLSLCALIWNRWSKVKMLNFLGFLNLVESCSLPSYLFHLHPFLFVRGECKTICFNPHCAKTFWPRFLIFCPSKTLFCLLDPVFKHRQGKIIFPFCKQKLIRTHEVTPFSVSTATLSQWWVGGAGGHRYMRLPAMFRQGGWVILIIISRMISIS